MGKCSCNVCANHFNHRLWVKTRAYVVFTACKPGPHLFYDPEHCDLRTQLHIYVILRTLWTLSQRWSSCKVYKEENIMQWKRGRGVGVGSSIQGLRIFDIWVYRQFISFWIYGVTLQNTFISERRKCKRKPFQLQLTRFVFPDYT